MIITSVSQEFYSYLINRFPDLKVRSFNMLFSLLAFGSRCDSSDQLLIPQTLLASFEQKTNALKSRNYCGLKFLKEFQARILPFFEFSDYRYKDGCIEDDEGGLIWLGSGCRVVLDRGFDDDLKARVRAELQSVPTPDRVNLLNGRKIIPATRKQARDAAQAEVAAASASTPMSPTAQTIVDYLHALDPDTFTKKLTQTWNRAHGVALAIQDQHRRDLALGKLRQILEQPKPYYRPSPAGRTCRLYGIGSGIPSLPRNIRKMLCAGWYEVDLCNAQLRILDGLTGGTILQGYEDQDLWDLFATFCGKTRAEAKAALKIAIYGILFGQTRDNTQIHLGQHDLSRLLKHPIVRRLYGVRAQQYDQIRKTGGMQDAFGAQQTVLPGRGKKGRRPNQILASVLQSYEMLLVEPIYDLAITGTPRFRVVLHLHDGVVVSISDRSRTPSTLMAILGAVEAAGKRIGIPMRAESTPL